MSKTPVMKSSPRPKANPKLEKPKAGMKSSPRPKAKPSHGKFDPFGEGTGGNIEIVKTKKTATKKK